MTITLAVHPWYGETVGALRSWGTSGVLVEREDGDRRIVRTSWTSLVPRVPLRLRDVPVIRIAPEAALELVRWVAPRLGREEEA